MSVAGNNDNDIVRHKTAIRRRDLSLPIKCALRDNLLVSTQTSVFDFGCGYGEDVSLLRKQAVECSGWDPNFEPNAPQMEADIVNLGYVINVIEDIGERTQTLQRAWQLARRLLIVAALVNVKGRGQSVVPFGDGIVTRIGTFQKEYQQSELREYVEQTLETDALPAALGVYYVFKDELLKQEYVAAKYRRRTAPRRRMSEVQFEAHRELLEGLSKRIFELGRLPFADEFDQSDEVVDAFGSMKRAFALIRRVTGHEDWEGLGDQQAQDLLVYLALASFRRRPKLSQLPISLQRDFRTFFKSYRRACDIADMLLFRAGDPEAIDDACKEANVGKLLPKALYIHQSSLSTLEPLLRIYEGCARSYLGEIEGANIIKLHRFSGKVSYLAYPDFASDPHPRLLRSVKLSLRSRDIECLDYAESTNPPILHRKETFLSPDHPDYEKFAKLTRQEERRGLLENAAGIGTQEGWQRRLDEHGVRLRGHRLVRA